MILAWFYLLVFEFFKQDSEIRNRTVSNKVQSGNVVLFGLFSHMGHTVTLCVIVYLPTLDGKFPNPSLMWVTLCPSVS